MKTRRRLMSDEGLEEIRTRLLTLLTTEPLGLTLSDLYYRLARVCSEHYVRTELRRLLEDGRVEVARRRHVLTGQLLAYYTARRCR